MLFRKLWRTMALYRAQFASMVIMIALGLGVFVGFNMEWYTLDVRMGEFYEQTGLADYAIFSKTAFGEQEAAMIESIDGVDRAARFMSMVAQVVGTKKDTVTLTVTEDESVSGFVVTSGAAYDASDTGGIWLSDRYAEKNSLAIGDELSLSAQGITVAGTVRGLVKSSEYAICVRDSSQLMPDFAVHGFAYISPALYERAVAGAPWPSVHVRSDMDRRDLEDEVQKILGYKPRILDRDANVSYAGPQGEVDEGKTTAALLPPIFLLIAMLSMVSTMHRIASQEKTQIETLKALGFKDARILRHYTSYALMVGLLGTALGMAVGWLICRAIMYPTAPMGAYLDMPDWRLALPAFTLPAMGLVIAGLTAIGYLSVRRMLHSTAADALRPYAPEKVEALRLESSAWFSRLSFGARWNLRDAFRHKARTVMSVAGVMGCLVIILACLGMGDTVNSYVSNIYIPSMNYESRIYLAPQASPGERDELIERLGPDTSQTLGVEIEGDKPVALHIYRQTGDSVGFIDEDGRPFELGDEGAYICVRIAREYGLGPGDEAEVSMYGTDETYRLKVAGIARSTMEESIVMSSAYARKAGIDFTPDSIYSAQDGEDIDKSPAIAQIQSRESITSAFGSFIQIMDMFIYTSIAMGMLLGIVVLYNLGAMTYTERYRELATLKVVGFRDSRLGRLIQGQTLALTVAGILPGIPIAQALLGLLMDELAAEYEMVTYLSPVSYLVSIALTLGVSMLVSVMMARRNKKIDMVSALKSAE